MGADVGRQANDWEVGSEEWRARTVHGETHRITPRRRPVCSESRSESRSEIRGALALSGVP